MLSDEIRTDVRVRREEGQSEEAIRTALRAGGWNEDEIMAALEEETRMKPFGMGMRGIVPRTIPEQKLAAFDHSPAESSAPTEGHRTLMNEQDALHRARSERRVRRVAVALILAFVAIGIVLAFVMDRDATPEKGIERMEGTP